MTKETSSRKAWTKPEIFRLGAIKDIAGAQTPVSQASNVKS
jgi:hypothetical protein